MKSYITIALPFFLLLLVGCHTREPDLSFKTTDIPDNSFAVVELFTSLGCPSCPSAEREMNHLVDKARQLDIPLYVLTYHVDYWNRKDWSDPYSLPASSNRQRMYAGVLHSKNIHTPQSVLNGVSEFSLIGSRQYMDSISQELKQSPHRNQSIRAKIARLGDSLRISITLGKVNPREQLIIIMTQRSGQPDINMGENAGKKIKCVNIVRYLTDVACTDIHISHTFKIPDGLESQPGDIVLLTQNKLTGRITGALKTPFIKGAPLSSL